MLFAPADNVELGTACGKLHRVSVLAITDAGQASPPECIFAPPARPRLARMGSSGIELPVPAFLPRAS